MHLTDVAKTVAYAVDAEESRAWNIGGGGLTSLMRLAETCAEVTGATVEQSRRKARRKPRILNWVDDSRARRDLQHTTFLNIADVSEISRELMPL